MGDSLERRFPLLLAFGAAFVALLPFLLGATVFKPGGATFLGTPFAADDTMVYSAWMRQAMDGRVLFDNRFAVDPQAGLTLHVYFLVLGWVAKGVGIPWAMALARAAFSYLFVCLAWRLIRKVADDHYTQKLTLAVVVIGGGLGFLMWHLFGVAFAKPSPLSPLFGGRLPIDVWQTEAFVFPSMLVNGLFMASLCLIVGIFLLVLESRESWKPVLPGAICFALLMNIHSYDVLLVTLVLVAFLAVQVVQKQATGAWAARVVVMGLGAVPPALWFVNVLQKDAVFQARAATPTYAANFQTIIGGLAVLIALACYGLLRSESADRRTRTGVIALGVLSILGFGLAASHAEGFWMGLPVWGAVFCLAVGVSILLSGQREAANLVTCWAIVGLVAPYFPALFQRKLAMGLSVPWAILGGVGFAAVIIARERGVRNLVAVFGLAILGGTSVQWFFRDLGFIRENVSNTTLHPVYLTANMEAIMRALDKVEGKKVVLAMPGIAQPLGPDAFGTPYLPDLNPIASGLTGAYSYAGHWSETPDYGKRRNDAALFFLREDPELRSRLVSTVDYLIAPVPEAFPAIAELNEGRLLADVRTLGDVVVDGNQFRLIKVRRGP